MMRSILFLALAGSLAMLWSLGDSTLSTPNPTDATDNAPNQLVRQQADPPLPTPPPTPPPDGRRRPGGGLSGEEAACPQTELPLTALTPLNVQGVTLSQQPTFWFYTPYTSEDVRLGQFSLFSADDSQRLYRTSFQLPKTPGLVSISWPDSVEFSLQQDLDYHWYLTLFCTPNQTSRPDFTLNGWVRRLASTPERRQQISQVSDAEPPIWYDTVDFIAAQLLTPSPATTSSLRQDWTKLLNSVGLAELSPKPVLGPVLPIDNTGGEL